ncbi:ClpP/crotonase-like domain-containing protein [Flagelloscypha sp. PMI_526]|nr:ClpP/crotonase-like domain-containing protein [Flagelloscypha sp. PMI_526]
MTSYPLSLPAAQPLVTLTHPTDSLWILELHHGQDSRLTVELIDGGVKPAALIIVGRKDQDKFFSNGLDLAAAAANPNFFPTTFNPLLARLLTFPLPTIAAINGHAFAGGCMLSLACDYRIMVDGLKRRAWMCMNEVQFGAVWPLSFTSVLRGKFGDTRIHRQMALEGHRFTPQEALKLGLIDHIAEGTTASVIAKAEELANSVSTSAQGGVLISIATYFENIAKDPRITNPLADDAAAKYRLARL